MSQIWFWFNYVLMEDAVYAARVFDIPGFMLNVPG